MKGIRRSYCMSSIRECGLTSTKGRQTYQRYAFAALTVVVGLIFGLPHIIMPLLLPHGAHYTPFVCSDTSSLTYDETVNYGPAANYTARTLLPPYDPGTYEYRNGPTPVGSFPYYVVAPFQWVTGSAAGSFIIADFIFPALAFVLGVLILRRIGVEYSIAFAATLLMLIPSVGLRNTLAVVYATATGKWHNVIAPLEYSRFPYPEFSFTLLLAGIYLLMGAERSRAQAIAAGAAVGAMFYTYLYCWTVAVPGCVLLFIYRSWEERKPSTRMLLVNGVAALTALPFAINYWRFSRSPMRDALTEHFQWTYGHIPDRETLIWTVAFGAALILAWYLAGGNRGYVVLWAMVIGGLCAYNGQIVLGRTLESFHFPNRFFQPALALTCGAALGMWALARRPRLTRCVAVATVAVILGVALLRQAAVSVRMQHRHELDPRWGELFDWLHQHGRSNEVVVTSNEELNYLLPTMTRDFTYVPFFVISMASFEEAGERFVIALKLLGHEPDYIADVLRKPSLDTAVQIHLGWPFHLFRSNRPLSSQRLAPLFAEWQDTRFPRDLRRYRMDYVLVTKDDPVERKTIESFGLSMVAQGGFGDLYRVPHM